jgi:transglutaminase/protease-like cytokinesis protein 3
LTTVKIDRATPINIGSNTFPNRDNATLFVPAGSEEAYKTAPYWMEFKTIKTLNKDVAITGLSLDETNISLSQIGDTHQLKAIIEPSNATNKTINWNSSNFAVCTVTETGLVIAKGCGKANVVATTVDGGYTATCEVTVTQPVEALALEKHSLTLKIGETERLYTQIAPLLAGNKTVNWSSADEEVASVDSMGTVKALAAGETWIMAVSDDNPEAKDSCIVIVPDTPAPAPNGECATPVIIASGNKITFECETPDAEFTSYLTASEEISGGEVVIENKDRTYTLTVYATAPGYDRSKPATMKIIFKNGDMNLDGIVNLADITTLIKMIAGQK